MDYTLEAARSLAEELRAIPAKDPSKRRLDKQGMVRELAKELIALQHRGYTIEEVAESLRGRGLDITTPTLKNYLQRAKGREGKRSRARRPPGPPRSTAEAGDGSMPEEQTKPLPAKEMPESPLTPRASAARAASPMGASGEPTLRSGKGAFLVKDKESY